MIIMSGCGGAGIAEYRIISTHSSPLLLLLVSFAVSASGHTYQHHHLFEKGANILFINDEVGGRRTGWLN